VFVCGSWGTGTSTFPALLIHASLPLQHSTPFRDPHLSPLVTRGWDEGILGGEGIPPMKVGGKRLLVVPAKLGYGDRGAGGGLIPGGATLTFDVELVAAP
jgi:hypothetical protein